MLSTNAASPRVIHECFCFLYVLAEVNLEEVYKLRARAPISCLS